MGQLTGRTDVRLSMLTSCLQRLGVLQTAAPAPLSPAVHPPPISAPSPQPTPESPGAAVGKAGIGHSGGSSVGKNVLEGSLTLVLISGPEGGWDRTWGSSC